MQPEETSSTECLLRKQPLSSVSQKCKSFSPDPSPLGNFSKLSPEIRCMIWGFCRPERVQVLGPNHAGTLWENVEGLFRNLKTHRRKRTTLAILRTSKHIYAEASVGIYRQVTLLFHPSGLFGKDVRYGAFPLSKFERVLIQLRLSYYPFYLKNNYDRWIAPDVFRSIHYAHRWGPARNLTVVEFLVISRGTKVPEIRTTLVLDGLVASWCVDLGVSTWRKPPNKQPCREKIVTWEFKPKDILHDMVVISGKQRVIDLGPLD
ncbi:MAG: hypothetical protein M1834_008801 [Cirrosporium novae-zelandiae]|nr:MAG: hypothetical protein M1834_008801 [Cirrosporium novae-zelandiae]